MKLRYKHNKAECRGSKFNILACCPDEVLTGDDSVYVTDLEVWLEQKQEWKDMVQAFKDHDLIRDNHNQYFFEPANEEDRKRGYTLT